MPPLTLLSSMAVKPLLGALLHEHEARTAGAVRMESVGGVEAARRVQAGEAFDLVVLAHDALAGLAGQGWVHTPVAIAQSQVALAVREGAPQPDIGSEAAVRDCLSGAATVAYSTGPSGQALLALLQRWGLHEALRERLVQVPPGVPVSTLVRTGQAQIGVQQLSELQAPGVVVLGGLPPPIEAVTTFSAAVGTRSHRPADAQALLAFLAGPDAAAAKRAHWMTPPQAAPSFHP